MKQVTMMKAKLAIMESIQQEKDWNEDTLKRIEEEPNEYSNDFKDEVNAKAQIYEALLNVLYKTEKWGI